VEQDRERPPEGAVAQVLAFADTEHAGIGFEDVPYTETMRDFARGRFAAKFCDHDVAEKPAGVNHRRNGCDQVRKPLGLSIAPRKGDDDIDRRPAALTPGHEIALPLQQ
jgi:hypothetical protein